MATAQSWEYYLQLLLCKWICRFRARRAAQVQASTSNGQAFQGRPLIVVAPTCQLAMLALPFRKGVVRMASRLKSRPVITGSIKTMGPYKTLSGLLAACRMPLHLANHSASVFASLAAAGTAVGSHFTGQCLFISVSHSSVSLHLSSKVCQRVGIRTTTASDHRRDDHHDEVLIMTRNPRR